MQCEFRFDLAGIELAVIANVLPPRKLPGDEPKEGYDVELVQVIHYAAMGNWPVDYDAIMFKGEPLEEHLLMKAVDEVTKCQSET